MAVHNPCKYLFCLSMCTLIYLMDDCNYVLSVHCIIWQGSAPVLQSDLGGRGRGRPVHMSKFCPVTSLHYITVYRDVNLSVRTAEGASEKWTYLLTYLQ